MADAQQNIPDEPARGLLARPLDALVFLLPLIVFYEITSLTRSDRVIAFDLMRRFFQLFGPVGIWAPGTAVITILLATHVTCGARWTVHWRRVAEMYVEAAALAVPLLALSWAIPLTSPTSSDATVTEHLAMAVGAGVYEELVFRLILISLTMMIGSDLLGYRRAPVAATAIAISSLAFSAHHYVPIGMEPWHLGSFAFRSIAGAYLAVIFWYRGYGSAAGTHAAYNVGLIGLEAMLPA